MTEHLALQRWKSIRLAAYLGITIGMGFVAYHAFGTHNAVQVAAVMFPTGLCIELCGYATTEIHRIQRTQDRSMHYIVVDPLGDWREALFSPELPLNWHAITVVGIEPETTVVYTTGYARPGNPHNRQIQLDPKSG